MFATSQLQHYNTIMQKSAQNEITTTRLPGYPQPVYTRCKAGQSLLISLQRIQQYPSTRAAAIQQIHQLQEENDSLQIVLQECVNIVNDEINIDKMILQ